MQAICWDVFLILGLILASGLLATSEFAIGSARKSRLRDWSSRGYPGAGVALGSERRSQAFALDGSGGDDAPGHAGRRSCRGDGRPAPDPRDRTRRPAGPLSPIDRGGDDRAGDHALRRWCSPSLVPRRIATVRPERIARLVSRPVWALATVAVPFVSILSGATDACCASWAFVPGRSRRSRRKRSRSCCGKGPRRASSRKASTR